MKLTESYWSATSETELLQSTCASALRDAAAAEPDRVALIEGIPEQDARRRYTYAELLDESEKMARALLEQFERGDHVAVWAPNCPEWIILQYGIALAGLVMVTVNPAYQPSELKYVLEQSRADGIFFATQYRGNPMADIVAEVIPQIEGLKAAISLDEIEEFVGRGNPDRILPDIQPSDPAMIQYTSGTTGFPKGARLNHYSLSNNGRLTALLRNAGNGSIDISAMPCFHTGGCVAGTLATHQTLGTLVLAREFEPNLFLDLIEQEQANYTLCVPTMLVALLEAQEIQPRDMSSMQIVLSGASTVPMELVKRIEEMMGINFCILFGQTETSPVITMVRLHDSIKDKVETLGQPLDHTEVKIVDPETGETVPVGTVGELCTRGYLVMMDYFEMPEATAKTIDADGWLHTGDLCSMDERGFCYIEGRLKDMIIRGGENIYPREIEEKLFEHEAIAEIAVVGIPDEKWGEQVGAFVRLNDGMSASAEELHDYLRAHLAPQKTPKLWVQMAEFPMTGSGKIQKFKLAQMFSDGEIAPNM
ncbi:MAG: AMP-binding protein [Pseudomonadota bacterium]